MAEIKQHKNKESIIIQIKKEKESNLQFSVSAALHEKNSTELRNDRNALKI